MAENILVGGEWKGQAGNFDGRIKKERRESREFQNNVLIYP